MSRLRAVWNHFATRLVVGAVAVNALLLPALYFSSQAVLRATATEQFLHHARTRAFHLRAFVDRVETEQVQALLERAVMNGELRYAARRGAGERGFEIGEVPERFREDFRFGEGGDATYNIAVPLKRGELRLGFNEGMLEERLDVAGQRFLWVSAGYLALVLVLLAVVVPQLTRPLRRLGRQADRVAAGQTDVQLAPETRITELAEMAGDLERMRVRLVHQADELEHRALHDELTGLPNRARFREALDAAFLSETPFAVLLMDLDGFKAVNDTYGHPVGDEILRQVAARLESALPHASDLVARLGGDELAFLLRSPSLADSSRHAEWLRSQLDTPFEVSGRQLPLGASVGLVRFPDHGDTPSELLQRADAAMYAAKSRQEGVLTFDDAGVCAPGELGDLLPER